MYKLNKNYIEINDLSQFNIDQIVESGQIFSYEKTDDGYIILSGDKFAKVTYKNGKIKIYSKTLQYFVNYFDLNTNYNTLKEQIVSQYPHLKQIVDFGYGIRMLNQDLVEMFISWTISANNNIKRIKKSIKFIRENAGQNMGEYFAFPSLEKLKTLDEKFFLNAGCGYRAKQIVELISKMEQNKLKEFCLLDTTSLKSELLKFKGIGSKVADCILMSVYGRKDVFPVDTWIEKVYHQFFDVKQTNRKIMRENLVDTFKNLSAYVQQLFFFYKRLTN